MSATRLEVPFNDLGRQHGAIRAELERAFARVVDSSSFVRGAFVEQFEAAYAAFCEVDHVVGVANGTDALELVFEALPIEPGRDVVTIPTTFVATAEAIRRTDGSITLVDIDERTWLMDVGAARDAVTDATAAIVPVHLYGNPDDLDAITELARERSVPVVEDAAQAHGARAGGRRAGSIGDAGTFSFYPGKNLGALGDGGAVVTRSAELATRVRELADHGRVGKHEHATCGRNSRLDALQAAFLSVKLPGLEQQNARRRDLAARYRHELGSVGDLRMPEPVAGSESVHHLFVVATPVRDELRRHLSDEGVSTGIHYPVPVHLVPAFRDLGYARGDFPVAERLANEIVSLPIYADLDDRSLDHVIQQVRRFFDAA